MSSNIRGTIEILSNILRENGSTRVRAEAFRLAKFDQEDAVEAFWRLLFELLYYCEYGRIDEVAIRAWSRFTTEEQVVYVKREMAERGFYSRDFANLPESQTRGSRELLLSFGWLMCKENIIHRFMNNRTSPLDEELNSHHKLKTVEDRAASAGLDLSIGRTSEPARRVQQLLWLNNKLRMNLRNLYNTERQKSKLRHKLYEATTGVSTSPERNHLTVLEIYMIKNPEVLRKNLKLLEKDSERLQHLLDWKSHEDTFWKWMESVLDAKLQNKQQQQLSSLGSADADDRVSSTDDARSGVSTDIIYSLVQQHDNLRSAIMKYESIVSELETVWKEKESEVTEEELDSILASIDLELSLQRASIALNNTEAYLSTQPSPPPPAEPLLIYDKPERASRITQIQSASTTITPASIASSASEVREEIDRLYGAVSRLQKEVEDKQSVFKTEMQIISNRLQNAIVVPPMEYNI